MNCAVAHYGGKSFFYNKVLLRLRGFLHAFHLVEMTTKKSTVISSVVERSPSLWYEQWRKKTVAFSHRNFTSDETSLVIDKLHFP